jgi:hypothetical protein
VDGGVLHNNPVEIAMQESRRLAEARNLSLTPDILLSVGTGLHKVHHPSEMLSDAHPGSSQNPVNWLRTLFTMISYQVRLNLDSERRWAQQRGRQTSLKDWMYRINPDLGVEPPPMDAFEEVARLEDIVRGWVNNSPEAKDEITNAACLLVASSFYFERNGNPVVANRTCIELPGIICCRLKDESAVAGIGKFIANCHPTANFVIENTPKSDPEQRIKVPIQAMVRDGYYKQPLVDIVIPGEDAETMISLDIPAIDSRRRRFPISGFPRSLIKQDFGSRQI